jgi:hypothetical protein
MNTITPPGVFTNCRSAEYREDLAIKTGEEKNAETITN